MRSPAAAEPPTTRPVTAKHPNHVFNVDLTTFATAFGFWVPWLPPCWVQRWPFCWCIGVVMDHYSRRIVALGLWRKEPTSAEVIAMLEAAAASAGGYPKYIISDQGTQFREEYRDWCQARGVRPRFGAVGRFGSIAVLERFMRSLKAEGLRRLLTVPLDEARMTEELAVFVDWYNEERPHCGLGGDTPNEVYFDRPRARAGPRFEVRGPYPTRDVELRAEAGTVVELHVERFRGRDHLPVIELRRAA
jgi:transposase InsO family protein